MIVFGFGKVTKKVVGLVFERACQYCNSTHLWQLCIIRTWFTLFFIPIIPYSKRYCVVCPNCGSFVELTEAQFEEMKLSVNTGKSQSEGFTKEGEPFGKEPNREVPDHIKYAGKTQTQINYLKEMEALKKGGEN